VKESSFWDELCTAIKKNDTNWIQQSMVASVYGSKSDANVFLILDTNGKVFYEKELDNKVVLKELVNSVSDKILQIGKSQKTEKVCLKVSNDKYFQGYVDRIVPGKDFEKKTKPQGYLLVGEILNDNHFANLQELNKDFSYSIVDSKEKTTSFDDSIDRYNNRFFIYKKAECLNSEPLIIKATSYYPETKSYLDFVKIGLFLFFLFVLVSLGLLYRYFFRYFFKPLLTITNALENESPQILSNVKTKNTELGKVAKLIDLYFKQNKEYESEIKQRAETEMELKWAVGQIESAMLAKVRAEQSAEAKSEFLATMSHEIRTPINGVIGVANLLSDEDLTARQKEYVDILSYSSKHLLALVSDILDFSKIETGKVEFESSSFNLNTVCNSIYQVFKIAAENKKIDIHYIPDETVSYSIYGDSVRVNQILTNLVGNAIKFTEKGSVTLSYKQLSKTNNNCTIEFSIKDTGIGIATNEQDKIFDGFSQANNKISSKFGGTGLGLSISKKLIELQGGKLSMTSEIGQGTEFTFYLTFETHAYDNVLPAPQSTTINKKTDKLEGMKVLVAEDNNINILVLKRFLEKWGINYMIATNGLLALELLEKNDFDLVLMDIHMPEMDGEEATLNIRAHRIKRIAEIPVIALTANASVDMQQKLLSHGFTNYISKPFNPDSLFRLLKKHYFSIRN
jgi:signal transduction histidine kinase/ActR/RegA family two-component response regulator